MNWNKVEDSLPKEEDWCYDVLVCRLGEEVGETGSYLSYLAIGYYEHGSKIWYNQSGEYMWDVTHWAELPENPL